MPVISCQLSAVAEELKTENRRPKTKFLILNSKLIKDGFNIQQNRRW